MSKRIIVSNHLECPFYIGFEKIDPAAPMGAPLLETSCTALYEDDGHECPECCGFMQSYCPLIESPIIVIHNSEVCAECDTGVTETTAMYCEKHNVTLCPECYDDFYSERNSRSRK